MIIRTLIKESSDSSNNKIIGSWKENSHWWLCGKSEQRSGTLSKGTPTRPFPACTCRRRRRQRPRRSVPRTFQAPWTQGCLKGGERFVFFVFFNRQIQQCHLIQQRLLFVPITLLAKEAALRVASPKSPIFTEPVGPVIKMLSHFRSLWMMGGVLVWRKWRPFKICRHQLRSTLGFMTLNLLR